jgi:membrane-associated phospholipid phosphatase
MSIQLISAYLFSGIAAQILKRLVEAPRPAAFFPKGSYQFFIDGVTHSGHNSFPSGHATSVFALATIFALNDGNNIRRIAYLIIAVVTGYSRIYLGQHFLIDVIAGATMGVVFGIIFYLVVNFVKSRRKRQQIMEENSYLFS